ncbi:MAG: hypothetical protein HYT08_02210 [Candidatus Levybacteria bacterium]|nr:hypothetical protein [Candidatus Levybacteria bacterium]
MLSYYKTRQLIAKINRNGKVIGQIDKWQTHRKGILHKALTIAIFYKDFLIIQHRKHPAFDGVFDITSSSHQLFIDGKLQSSSEATYATLKREWNLSKKDILYEPLNKGAIYYRAKDTKSEFTEHEMCDILVTEVKKLPTPNFDFAYGFSLVKKKEILNKKSRIYQALAPWVKKALEENLL